jgi:hypothetical protein
MMKPIYIVQIRIGHGWIDLQFHSTEVAARLAAASTIEDGHDSVDVRVIRRQDTVLK